MSTVRGLPLLLNNFRNNWWINSHVSTAVFLRRVMWCWDVFYTARPVWFDRTTTPPVVLQFLEDSISGVAPRACPSVPVYCPLGLFPDHSGLPDQMLVLVALWPHDFCQDDNNITWHFWGRQQSKNYKGKKHLKLLVWLCYSRLYG